MHSTRPSDVEIHDKGKTLKRIVGDGDSTFKANIKYSYILMLNDENYPFTANDWPRTASGAWKKDTGKLALRVPQVEEDLTGDPTHCTRVFTQPLYKQAKKTKANNPQPWTKKRRCREVKNKSWLFPEILSWQTFWSLCLSIQSRHQTSFQQPWILRPVVPFQQWLARLCTKTKARTEGLKIQM